MKPSETADLLGLAAFYDNRTVDEHVTAAWHDAIGDLDYADAVEAVRAHYGMSTDWLMPAHVRARVKAARAARAIRADQVQPPDGFNPDDVPGYLDWLRRELASVAAGGQPTVYAAGRRTMAELPAVDWPKRIPERESREAFVESRRLAEARAEIEALHPKKAAS